MASPLADFKVSKTRNRAPAGVLCPGDDFMTHSRVRDQGRRQMVNRQIQQAIHGKGTQYLVDRGKSRYGRGRAFGVA